MVYIYIYIYSVQHNWIIKALQLAKVPSKIINAISKLMIVWATKIILRVVHETIETWIINYLTSVLQGDFLSLLLFILSVNPLSFLQKNLTGYKIGDAGERDISISHVFFFDDLKHYIWKVRNYSSIWYHSLRVISVCN